MHPKTEAELPAGQRTLWFPTLEPRIIHTTSTVACRILIYQPGLCCGHLLRKHTLPATTDDAANEQRLH